MKHVALAFTCAGNLSLDKNYLQSLSGGKENVKEVVAVMDLDSLKTLQQANSKTFDFELFDRYRENCNEEDEYNYFIQNAKCISLESHRVEILSF